MVGHTAAPTECVLLGTCVDIRRKMKSWVISSEDDDRKVELDIRDICGHLDTTLQGRPGTISGRIQREITQLAADGALPLGFKGKLQILQTKSRPSALHGAGAGPMSKSAMTSSRTAFCAAAWSSKMLLANTGAILFMLDDP